MKRITPIWVIFFLFLAACVALCQSRDASADLLQRSDGPDLGELQRHELQTRKSFPDAPSAQPPTQAEKFRTFIEEARSPLTFGAAGADAWIMHETEPGRPSSSRQAGLTDLYKGALVQKESSAFFGKYLYPALLKQDPRYYPANAGNFWGRVMYATSRVLITRNDSGKSTLNRSYLLGVLTSVAITTAYRPYWRRSTSATFKSFGSTIGSDAGINLLHEFEPDIRQMIKGHAPKFVSGIEDRITNSRTSTDVFSDPKWHDDNPRPPRRECH